jgi:hypothetical protein
MMNITEAKTIKLGNTEFPNIKWRSRIVFEYEALTGQSYYQIGSSVENQFKLFYCAAKVGSTIAGKEFKLTYEQFLDLTDDYFTETVTAFTSALYTEAKTEESKKKLK